ncbi:SOCS box domain-containing protein [Caerostris darwini]|uniref:SOCS box domain-containing protein n=1 Tax=Caerostris darwini TaxID=1538125 RepID=A0AAV4NYI2_9ARAC|nr:SOCS box domain-containing protein [Caerostris darwini]
MEHLFSNEIRYKKIVLTTASEVSMHSFIVRRSLEPLDISMLPDTEEGVRKMHDERRQILYKFHLDLPKDLEISLRNEDGQQEDRIYDERAFHIGKIEAFPDVYGFDFIHSILDNILISANKIERVRYYLKPLKFLVFDISKGHERLNDILFLYDWVLQVLYSSNCMDSDLVTDFIDEFDFGSWIIQRKNPVLLMYVLEHMRIKKYDLKNISHILEEVVYGCFYYGMYDNIRLLLEYGMNINFELENIDNDNSYEQRLRVVFEEGMLSERRAFLLKVFCRVYHNRTHRGILAAHFTFWRSVPDYYPTYQELLTIFKDSARMSRVTRMSQMATFLNEDGNANYLSKPKPRTLRHLSRIAVRTCLNRNSQLPVGIYHLDIPRELKPYLNLEC